MKRNFFIVDVVANKTLDRIYAANGKSAIKQFLSSHAMMGIENYEVAKIAGCYRAYNNKTSQYFAAID